jgi:hypothetical protein
LAAQWFYFCFPLLYLAHMHEEYWTGFTQKFPPPRLRGPLADRGFWVLNPLLLSIATAVGVGNLMGAKGAFFWVALWASICLWNACVHAAWSVVTRAYQPGLVSGLFYAPLFGVWLWMVARQDHAPWGTIWLALWIGLAIMIILPGIAFIGRRVYR